MDGLSLGTNAQLLEPGSMASGARPVDDGALRHVRRRLEQTQRNLERIRRIVARMQQDGQAPPPGADAATVGASDDAGPGACDGAGARDSAGAAEPRALDFDAVSCLPPGQRAADKLRTYRAFSSR